MFDKTYLVYLGIGLVIALVAFFAYQELQKHKTEIEKLRYDAQKLEKIIHAYNMRQYHADPSEEPNTDDEEESGDDDEQMQNRRSPQQSSERPPPQFRSLQDQINVFN